MKRLLNKKLRLAFIVIGLIIFLASAFTVIISIKNPGFKEETTTLFSCENNAEAGYNVYLKTNPLYETSVIGQDKYVITEFVDHIDANYTYKYTGNKKAKITGYHEIVAMVECFTKVNDEEIIIWSKPYILSPREVFEKDSVDWFSVDKTASIDLSAYNNFVKEIAEASKINALTRVTAFMNINIKAETEAGIIEEKLSPKIVIPLDTPFFTIGLINDEKPIVIEQLVQTPLPVNRTLVYFFIGIGAVALLLTLYLLIYTEGVNPEPHEKILKKIFKNHGDRLVALKSSIQKTSESIFEVNSIEDLVRISDDIEKPILYQFSEDKYDIRKFYILHEKEMYILDITENIINRERDEPEIHELNNNIMDKKAAAEKPTIAISGTEKATW